MERQITGFLPVICIILNGVIVLRSDIVSLLQGKEHIIPFFL